MRSSKSRSRNKNNNNNRGRQSGNNMNRVFDSSGPEGKVRGTPQQIIEKYSQLARDATLGNDRVAAENFQQHSEHYTRMQAEAQLEIDTKREQQEAEHRERQQAREAQNRHEHTPNDQPRSDQQPVVGDQQPAAQPGLPPAAADLSQTAQPDVAQPIVQENDSGLVETPEQAPVKRRTRKPKTTPLSEAVVDEQPESPKAAE